MIFSFLVVCLSIAWAASSNPFALKDVSPEQAKSTVTTPAQHAEGVEPVAATLAIASASQNIVYTYDALGRLVCVQDTVAGNSKYDYDDAGNRTNVSTVACN